MTAIIGPSGCGKSTFLRSINRMHDLIPTHRYQGEIRLDGVSIFAPGTDLVTLRQRVGMVFQRPNPFPKTIYENVAYGPALNRVVAAPRPAGGGRTLPAAGRAVGRGQGPARHAAGPASPVASSSACASPGRSGTSPRCCSWTSPAPRSTRSRPRSVEELIVELKQDYTIVIVTHNMQQAARVSDYTAFFDRGELIEFGETERVFTAPANERTEAYITGRFG